MNRRDLYRIQNGVSGEVAIQLGMEYSQSEGVILPMGKSFLFFHNMCDQPFNMRVKDMNTYTIYSGKSGVITYELNIPISTQIQMMCPTKFCQGLAMIVSCAS